MDLKKIITPLVDYQKEKTTLSSFIHFFSDNNNNVKYLNQITQKKIEIDINDLSLHDLNLLNRMRKNMYTYLNILYQIIDTINVPNDVVMAHRLERIKEKFPDMQIYDLIPSGLMRDYTISFIPEYSNIFPIRNLRSDIIGNFITTRGIITKVSCVKPKLIVAVYVCDSCGSETYQQINNKEFSILTVCGSKKCALMKIKGTLSLITRVSKFIPHLVLTIQEIQGDVPEGSIPRIINVEMDYNTIKNENEVIAQNIESEKNNDNENNYEKEMNIRPGDSVYLCGILMARQTNGLINEMYIEGYGVRPYKEDKIKYSQLENLDKTENILSLENEQSIPKNEENIENIEKTFSPVNILNSFAHHIYGLENVKKLLLLSIIGAPSILKSDGMRIRGNINILLIGDPGIAKSELLKYTLSLSQRGVYTAGRGSSGVGLTASVLRDPFTKEYVLEAGALVLSDMGVCCLDEMDKMDDTDRLSLHEVLEQQTVSINKAGINATLQARCTVLGAANFSSRYNKNKSIEWNTGLPTSLLSRFDSVLLLKDERNNEKDKALSDYVLGLHLNEKDTKKYLSHDDLKSFILQAQKINPTFSKSVNSKIKEAYIEARQIFERLTPRYLLSLIRISLANARFRLSETVEEEDVEEAIKLLKTDIKRKKSNLSPKYHIYNEIVKIARNNEITINDILSHLSEFSEELVMNTIKEFEENGIWVLRDNQLFLVNI